MYRCFETPAIPVPYCNREYRVQKRASFLHIPTSRGDRSASPPESSVSYFSRNFSDLETSTVFTEPPSTSTRYGARHRTVPVQYSILLLLCFFAAYEYNTVRNGTNCRYKAVYCTALPRCLVFGAKYETGLLVGYSIIPYCWLLGRRTGGQPRPTA